MFGRIQSGARLLGRVHGSAVSRQCQQALCELRSPLQQQQWLASSASLHRGASSAARPLAGKNIFQLRAAAEAVEAAAADEQQQQQQQPKQKQQKQKQPKQPHAQHQAQPEPPKMVPLPTSDESEQLLKIRHSVSLVGLVVVVEEWCSWWGADVAGCR